MFRVWATFKEHGRPRTSFKLAYIISPVRALSKCRGGFLHTPLSVIPAKAGIHLLSVRHFAKVRFAAFAGMTDSEGLQSPQTLANQPPSREISSVGRALRLHRRCREFESLISHHFFKLWQVDPDQFLEVVCPQLPLPKREGAYKSRLTKLLLAKN